MLEPAKRQAIIDAIRAGRGQVVARQIARQFQVSISTVSKIAKDEGLSDNFDRSLTARATAAKVQDNRAMRADLAALLLADTFKLRERMWTPSEQLLPSGKVVVLDLPPARDVRDFGAALQLDAKTHLELDAHDSDRGAEEARSVMSRLIDAITGQVAQDDVDPDD